MSSHADSRNAPTITPCLSYDDAPAAIAWLCRAFGFEKRMVVEGEHGRIAHAELVLGGGAGGRGMVMLASASRQADWQLTPRAVGGTGTCTLSVTVDDPDAHHARAVEAGARIVAPLETKEHGRGYGCRDVEGHLWYFGTYDPWAGEA